jgi:hypothetical protein
MPDGSCVVSIDEPAGRFGRTDSGPLVDGYRAFVTGWILTPDLGFEFVVRAYDLNSGAVLWSRHVNRGPQSVEGHVNPCESSSYQSLGPRGQSGMQLST